MRSKHNLNPTSCTVPSYLCLNQKEQSSILQVVLGNLYNRANHDEITRELEYEVKVRIQNIINNTTKKPLPVF